MFASRWSTRVNTFYGQQMPVAIDAMHVINYHVILLAIFACGTRANWNDWWTYEGISGPDFWGRLNPGLWGLCSTGRRQSPINIEPQRLLFDPQLQVLQVSKARVRGVLYNTGQGVVFRLETPQISLGDSLGQQSEATGHMADHGLSGTGKAGDHVPSVNISGGPLSYSYRVYEIQLHFGRRDHQGSEHLLAGIAFPAEIQIYSYNHELYANASEARSRAHGIAVVSVFIKITHPKETLGRGQTQAFYKESKMSKPNLELKMLTDQLQHITFKGDSVPIKALSVHELLPATSALITYEGSLTAPGCEETVTWILLNRPLYMSHQQLAAMRRLKQGDSVSPMAPLGNNFRPPQPLHQRAIRTNIDLVYYSDHRSVPDRLRDQQPPVHSHSSTAGAATAGGSAASAAGAASSAHATADVDANHIATTENFSAAAAAAAHNCPSMEAKKFYQVSPEHLAVSSNYLDT